MNSVEFRHPQSRDPAQREEGKRLIMKEMANHFFETQAAQVPLKDVPRCLSFYLQGVLDLKVREAIEGSLHITVECSTLDILERL